MLRVFGCAVALLVLGCAASGGEGAGGGTAASSGATSTGPGGGGGLDLTDGGVLTNGGVHPDLDLVIEPKDPILDVEGVPENLPLVAKLSNGSAPTAVNWFLDDVTVGTISVDGIFQSQGFVAGKAKVTAQAGSRTATTTVTVRVKIVDNPGGLSMGYRTLLESGGAADAGFRWLYPYDKTIFPRGLSAPSLQFGGAAADAMYIRITFGDFEYRGFYGASMPVRAELPAPIWKAVTTSAGATDTVSVEATKLSGGTVTGPVKETWRIAQGSLKGIIYYNTYKSKLTDTGAVMRVRPGESAEVLIGGCTVCHSVSAKGNVLVASTEWGTADPLDSASYDLKQDGSVVTRFLDDDGRKFSFGALTPDGAVMLSNGTPNVPGGVLRGLQSEYPSKLFDTLTGKEIAATSFTDLVTYAVTPAFSPDGKRVAFNWFDKNPAKTLAVMDVDLSQSPPIFSNLTEIVAAKTGVLAWPSFTADAGAVLYHEGDLFDTTTYPEKPAYAEVRLVDVEAKSVSSLAALNGRKPSGEFYLPYGEAEEGNLGYEPNVLPVPVGGYYWVLFTSRRAYGNTIAPGGTVPGGDNKWGEFVQGTGESPSPRKKIWVAAIDLDYKGKLDPSHPAFYLPGQEVEAGNMRGFAALEPCKPDGATCESAAECCGGFCREVDPGNGGPSELQCVPAPGGCSKEDEVCSTAADCCNIDSGTVCINGRCAAPTPK